MSKQASTGRALEKQTVGKVNWIALTWELASLIGFSVVAFSPFFVVCDSLFVIKSYLGDGSFQGAGSAKFEEEKRSRVRWRAWTDTFWLLFCGLISVVSLSLVEWYRQPSRGLLLAICGAILAILTSFVVANLEKYVRFRLPERSRKNVIYSLEDNIDDMKRIEEFFENPKGSEKLSGLNDVRYSAYEKYYLYSRAEIDREDGITKDRLNLTLTFQSFLVAGNVFLTSGIMSFFATVGASSCKEGGNCIEFHKLVSEPYVALVASLMAVTMTFCGMGLSIHSFRGVRSSRKSLLWAKDSWVKFNAMNPQLYPSLFPQLTKRAGIRSFDKNATDRGSDFALAIPAALTLFWLVLYWTWVGFLFHSVGFFAAQS